MLLMLQVIIIVMPIYEVLISPANAELSRRKEIALTKATGEHTAVHSNNQILIIIFLKCFFLCLKRCF